MKRSRSATSCRGFARPWPASRSATTRIFKGDLMYRKALVFIFAAAPLIAQQLPARPPLPDPMPAPRAEARAEAQAAALAARADAQAAAQAAAQAGRMDALRDAQQARAEAFGQARAMQMDIARPMIGSFSVNTNIEPVTVSVGQG